MPIASSGAYRRDHCCFDFRPNGDCRSAERLDRTNHGEKDQSEDQPVFDGGGTARVTSQFVQEIDHSRCPNRHLSKLTVGRYGKAG